MKKRWKRIAALWMSATLLVSLTACGNSSSGEAEKGESDSDTDEQIELTLGHIYVDASNGQTVAWEKALNEYRELHPNVTIKEDKADNDAYKTKLKTTLAAGSAPDVFCSWGGGFSTSFVEAGIVENLDPYVESGVIDMDQMLPNICNNFYYDDSLYGLPLDSFLGVLVCNQDVFDEYDVETPETLEDLYATSDVFNKNGIVPIAIGEKDKWPGLFPFGILALRYGGVDATTALLNGEGDFDQDYVRQSAETMIEMVDKGVFSDSAVALTNDEALNEFQQGRAAMYYSGTWQVGDFIGEGMNLTLVNFPSIEGASGDQNAYIGGASATLMVSAKSENVEAAVELAAFMSQKFSDYAYETGAILPTWVYKGGAELQDFQVRLGELMEGADGFCLAWNTLLDAEAASVHENCTQGFYAKQMTVDEYIKSMNATR
ncbi:extracellular solute-binding protein [Lachnospiraceae bacterium]|jgi:raffinose/stachyose/melibiose transport system substrate-binding protein|nr:extracellular solute-binding protein [uncultured Schaedlerella sp.]MCI9152523.1 extracellular solute-binding protein [Ruminococcus sp.]NBI59601.1 extracellular solute-binding protein [Lachnospiraceae bacterium]